MTSDRYHKAAQDGLLDVLREANSREVNAKDDVYGRTPVLWTAFEGRLDALRLLVGRGGDPDKSDQFGNTALHLAAAKGHVHCVDFLVKFGVNLFALDIDRHTAKDLAAINNRDDILRYLDGATAHLELTDKKKCKNFKEKAEKQCEKRIKEYMKKQQKIDETIDAEYNPMPHRPSTVLSEWKKRVWSSSQGNLKAPNGNAPIVNQRDPILLPNTTPKFSELVNGTISGPRGTVQRKVQASKAKQMVQQGGEFKVVDVDPNSGKRSVRSLKGVQRNSEVMYVRTVSSNGDPLKRGKLAGVFDAVEEVDGTSDTEEAHTSGSISSIRNGTISRTFSQPDLLNALDDDVSEAVTMQRPSGLFDRPMLGSLAFRRSVTAALSELHPDTSSIGSSNNSTHNAKSIKPRSHLVISDSDSDESVSLDDEDDEDEGNVRTSLSRFLAAWGLDEHLHIFEKQQIDLDTLMLLTESDLKSLELPLGPFRKLAIAIQERKNAFASPGPISDSRL